MEDEEGIASLVRAYLERDGFQVVWETRGLDGLQVDGAGHRAEVHDARERVLAK